MKPRPRTRPDPGRVRLFRDDLRGCHDELATATPSTLLVQFVAVEDRL